MAGCLHHATVPSATRHLSEDEGCGAEGDERRAELGGFCAQLLLLTHGYHTCLQLVRRQ